MIITIHCAGNGVLPLYNAGYARLRFRSQDDWLTLQGIRNWVEMMIRRLSFKGENVIDVLVHRIRAAFGNDLHQFRNRIGTMVEGSSTYPMLDGTATSLPPRPSVLTDGAEVDVCAHLTEKDAAKGLVWITVTIHSPADGFPEPDAWAEADAWAQALGSHPWSAPEFHGEWASRPASLPATSYRYAMRLAS